MAWILVFRSHPRWRPEVGKDELQLLDYWFLTRRNMISFIYSYNWIKVSNTNFCCQYPYHSYLNLKLWRNLLIVRHLIQALVDTTKSETYTCCEHLGVRQRYEQNREDHNELTVLRLPLGHFPKKGKQWKRFRRTKVFHISETSKPARNPRSETTGQARTESVHMRHETTRGNRDKPVRVSYQKDPVIFRIPWPPLR